MIQADYSQLLEQINQLEEVYPLILKCLGMTNERVADRLGVSSRAVQYWVAGAKNPTRSSWRMAAIALQRELSKGKKPKDLQKFEFYLNLEFQERSS